MKKRIIKALIFLIVLLSSYGCGDQLAQGDISTSADPLVITNGLIIDGTGSNPIQDGIIVIEEDQITFVGQTSDFSIPAGAEVIDAQGGTILPGIIDAHVHSTSNSGVRRNFLINGVTAVCDLGSPLNEMPLFEDDFVDQDAVSHGFHAGPILTAPGGLPDAVLHANLNYEIATPEEAREAVVELLNQGADFLKVYLHRNEGKEYPMLADEELSVIVDEAHSRGVLVRAHVTYISLLDEALKAGVDVIEHLPIHSPQSGPESVDEALLLSLFEHNDPIQFFFNEMFPQYNTQLEVMADEGIVMVPTLDRVFGSQFRAQNSTPEEKITLDVILGIVRRFHEYGGIIAMGTDFNTGVNMNAGIPIDEMEMLHAAGLTRLEVIEAATRHAAYVCGHGDELGTLEPGKVADVIVLDGNPLEDFQAMSNVVLVIKGGDIAHSGK